MKTARIFSAGVTLALLIIAQPVLAEEGWLEKLNPFAKKEEYNPRSGSRYQVKKAEPSPLEKLSAGTKKFFAGARDMLTGKRPAPKPRPTNQYAPWVRDSKDPRYARGQKKKKRSWLDSLFRREEPKPVRSLQDWVALPRVDS